MMMAGLSIYLINSLWKFYRDTGQGEWRQNSRRLLYRHWHPHRFLLQHWNLHKYFCRFGEDFFMSLGKGDWMSHNQLQHQLNFLSCQVQLEIVWLYSLQGHHIWCIFLNWGRKTFEHQKQRLRSVLINVPCHEGSRPSCGLHCWNQELWDIFSPAMTKAVSVSDPCNKSSFLCSSWVIPFQKNPQSSFREMLFLPEAGNFKLVKALFWANKSYSTKILIKNRCTGWLGGWKRVTVQFAQPLGKRYVIQCEERKMSSGLNVGWGSYTELERDCSLSSSHCSLQTFCSNSGLIGWHYSFPSPLGSRCAAPFFQGDERV